MGGRKPHFVDGRAAESVPKREAERGDTAAVDVSEDPLPSDFALCSFLSFPLSLFPLLLTLPLSHTQTSYPASLSTPR